MAGHQERKFVIRQRLDVDSKLLSKIHLKICGGNFLFFCLKRLILNGKAVILIFILFRFHESLLMPKI
jgi:hypothetical protein